MGILSKIKKAIKKVVSGVTNTVKSVVTGVVDTVKAVIKDPLPTIAAIAGQAIGIPAPVTAAAITAARGGDLGDIAKSATIAYAANTASNAVTPKISAAISPEVAKVVTNQAAAKAITAATSAALVNGTIAEATGGDFGNAAAGTFGGTMVAAGYQNLVAPDVIAKAEALGMSPKNAAQLSAAIRTGSAVGTGAAIAGGDFAIAFGSSLAQTGLSIAEGKASDALDQFAKDRKLALGSPTKGDIPSSIGDGVPLADNAVYGKIYDRYGNEIGQIAPGASEDAYNQVLAAFSQPKAPSQQFGLPTAQNIYGITPEGTQTLDDTQGLTDLVTRYGGATGVIPSLQRTEAMPIEQPSVLGGRDRGVFDMEAAAQDAEYAAMVDPTPENIQAAQDARMNLELSRRMAADQAKPFTGVPDYEFTSQASQQFPISITGEPTGLPSDWYFAQDFPVSISGEPTGIPSDWDLGMQPVSGQQEVSQLPVVEVTAEPYAYDNWYFDSQQLNPLYQRSPEDEPFVGQQFPISISGEPTGVESPAPFVYNTLGPPPMQQMQRQRRSPLNQSFLLSKQQQLLGDLGEGIVYTGGLPSGMLAPSMLARGGLVLLKKA